MSRVPDFVLQHSPCIEDEARLDGMRKAAAQHRQDMLDYQKMCGKGGDRDGARFFKEEATHALKTYRGACYALGYVTGTSAGDYKHAAFSEWPEEIEPFIRRAFSNLEVTA
jgi:hypothetical protein